MNSKGLTLAGAGGMLQKGRCQSLGHQAHAPDWMLTGVWRGEGRGKRCLQSVKKKKKNHSVSAKHLACCQAILGVREVIWEN